MWSSHKARCTLVDTLSPHPFLPHEQGMLEQAPSTRTLFRVANHIFSEGTPGTAGRKSQPDRRCTNATRRTLSPSSGLQDWKSASGHDDLLPFSSWVILVNSRFTNKDLGTPPTVPCTATGTAPGTRASVLPVLIASRVIKSTTRPCRLM